ncbi:MAG TPA: FAD-binding oxidoreductase [Oculatellaceae cyanobacterium]
MNRCLEDLGFLRSGGSFVPVNSTKALQTILREKISDGFSIFQGRRPSSVLQELLRNRPALKPFFVDLSENGDNNQQNPHNKVFEYRQEDQVISVETGITLGSLEKILALNHQYFPHVAQKESTLLDVINFGDRGYLEHSYSLRSMVLGLEVLLASGDTIRTGGKVVKNVTGYDLTKLFVGARGTLGIPVKAHLRVFATPEIAFTYIVSGGTFNALSDLASDLIKSGLPFTGVEIVLGSEVNEVRDFLVVNIAEHTQVVNELVPQLENFAQAYKVELRKLDEHQGSVFSEFLQTLETAFELDDSALSVSCSRSQYRSLVQRLEAKLTMSVHYRPGVGRLRLKFKNPDDRAMAIEQLRDYCTSTSVDLAVAYADTDFEYRVERLPENDPEVVKLKQGIKERFDFHRIMNPLAKL